LIHPYRRINKTSTAGGGHYYQPDHMVHLDRMNHFNRLDRMGQMDRVDRMDHFFGNT
jgi:hypothetical protein